MAQRLKLAPGTQEGIFATAIEGQCGKTDISAQSSHEGKESHSHLPGSVALAVIFESCSAFLI